MTPEQFDLASRILTRLLMLDDTSRCPDVQAIREVARQILEEQLRELAEGPPLSVRAPRREPHAA